LLPAPKDVVVTAWYTPQIPVSQGPGDFWGLPGLILEINNGGMTVLCSKITLNPKDKVEIKRPTKGEKVSSAEFEAIMMKKLEEMNEMNRPAGNSNGNVRTTTITIGG
jgi:GLPGLI family protein